MLKIVTKPNMIQKMSWILWLGLFLVVAVQSPADEQEVGSTNHDIDENVSKLIEKLDAKYLSDRVEAREKLVKMGQKAVDNLIQSARTGGYRTRKGSLLALGNIGDKKALPVLVEAYLSGKPDIQKTSRKALIQFGVLSFGHLDSYISKHPQSGQKIKGLLRQIVRKKVEEVFYGEISKEGGVGYYDGQFQEFDTYGRRIIPVLKTIARGEYDFREYPPAPPSHTSQLIRSGYFRQMAINAIGRVGSNEDIQFLREISADMPSALDPISRLSAIAMARLGEKGPLKRLRKRIQSSYQEALDSRDRFRIRSFGHLYSSLLSRTGENEKAIQVYKKLLEFREDDLMWYNLACSYAQVGKKMKAIEALKKANNLGYRDAGWLKIDGDMNPLRQMDEFQNLLKRMEQAGDESLRGESIFDNSDDAKKAEEKEEGKENSQED